MIKFSKQNRIKKIEAINRCLKMSLNNNLSEYILNLVTNKLCCQCLNFANNCKCKKNNKLKKYKNINNFPIIKRFYPTLTKKDDIPIQEELSLFSKETIRFNLKQFGFTDEKIDKMTTQEAFETFQKIIAGIK